MKRLLYCLTITIIALCSCDSKKSETKEKQEPATESTASSDRELSIVGKWFRWSKENGYSEYDIDPQYVTVFNEKMGRNKLEYKIENGTFSYLTIAYVASIKPSGDTAIVLQDGDRVATLTKFKNAAPFERIPEQSEEAAFNAYVDGFIKRADRYPKVTNVMESFPGQQ